MGFNKINYPQKYYNNNRLKLINYSKYYYHYKNNKNISRIVNDKDYKIFIKKYEKFIKNKYEKNKSININKKICIIDFN